MYHTHTQGHLSRDGRLFRRKIQMMSYAWHLLLRLLDGRFASLLKNKEKDKNPSDFKSTLLHKSLVIQLTWCYARLFLRYLSPLSLPSRRLFVLHLRSATYVIDVTLSLSYARIFNCSSPRSPACLHITSKACSCITHSSFHHSERCRDWSYSEISRRMCWEWMLRGGCRFAANGTPGARNHSWRTFDQNHEYHCALAAPKWKEGT